MQFRKSIAYIKKIISNQENIVEIVGGEPVSIHKVQNEYTAVPVKAFTNKDNNKNR
jgi:hypothetical protein